MRHWRRWRSRGEAKKAPERIDDLQALVEAAIKRYEDAQAEQRLTFAEEASENAPTFDVEH
eukprot:7877376-Lingulodinium_polyedra.AAC.1